MGKVGHCPWVVGRGTVAGEGTLQESDLKLMTALQTAQQCFTVSAANAHDLPIVYASEGFLQLTGFEVSQVLGRPALFLKVMS